MRPTTDDTASFHIQEHVKVSAQMDMDAGQASMLRAKQQLLALLLERVRDQTSYTRKQVLASWLLLAEHAKIPISHWVPVAQLAIGERCLSLQGPC